MNTVWKYKLPPDNILQMPRGARILCVHAQRDTICLWALVNQQHTKEARLFRVYGTGHEVPDDPGTYLGTVHLQDGALVFHVFEATP